MKTNMKKFSFPGYAVGMLGLCLALNLASCSDDDDYSAGSPTQQGAVGAYFDSNNTISFVLTPEDETVELTVSRTKTDTACVVPISMVSGDAEAIKVPESLAFATGDSTQTLTISLNGLAMKKTYNFKLAIGESAADHYSATQNGTTVYSGSLIVSKWKQLKDNITFYYYQNDKLPENTSELWQLDGVNNFYFTNFLGSGEDMYFSISGGSGMDLDDMTTLTGEIVPFNGKGAATFDYSTYKMHYVWLGLDENGYDIYNWSVGDTSISSFGWYGGYDYAADSWIDCSQNYVYLKGYINSAKVTGYVDVYGVWK